ncbi:MAG: ATP-binding cassette domain-containing protein [Planctomycetota bacterium]
MSDDAIHIQGLGKRFGQKIAVEGLDLTVPRGSLHGLIGPNGAGKTTTIRMIMSILFPDAGRLSVLGRKSAVESKDRIGYLPEERGVYRKMKVGAFLGHMAALKGVTRGVDAKIDSWLDKVDLSDVKKKRCDELSKGMQQKIQFISAVIHQPDLLILDEPFSGLDPVNMRLLRDLILEQHQAGVTIIFSTHVMFQAEQLCDHIVMIESGQKVLDNTLQEIRERYDPRSIVFEPDAGIGASPAEAHDGIQSVRQISAGVHEALLHDHADRHAVMAAVLESTRARRIELRRPTLEDVFISIVEERAGGDVDRDELRASLQDPAAAPAAQEATP